MLVLLLVTDVNVDDVTWQPARNRCISVDDGVVVGKMLSVLVSLL